MTTPTHSSLTDHDAVHQFAFVSDTDPGAVGAKKGWIDTSFPVPALWLRNDTDDGWIGISLVYAGVWDDLPTYRVGSIVNEAGSSYIAITENTNSHPPSADWQAFASGGADGIRGSIWQPSGGVVPVDGVGNDGDLFLKTGGDVYQRVGGHWGLQQNINGADGVDSDAAITTEGDIIIGGSGGTPDRLGIGDEGQSLQVIDGVPGWGDNVVDSHDAYTIQNIPVVPTFTSPPNRHNGLWFDETVGVDGSWVQTPFELDNAFKIQGENITFDSLTDGDVMVWVEADTNWTNIPASSLFEGFANPMTTPGDLILGGSDGVAERLPQGTDGQILTISSSTHLPNWEDAPEGGGGGGGGGDGHAYIDVYASPPSSPIDGDTWFPADGRGTNFIRSSGGWHGRFHGHPVVLPDIASAWTNFSGGTSTLIDAVGTLAAKVPNAEASHQNVWMKTIPSSPFYIELGMVFNTFGGQYPGAGLVLANSSNNKLILFYTFWDNQPYIAVDHWDSPSSYNGRALGGNGVGPGVPIWYRVEDDLTNFRFWVSYNGFEWMQFYSESRTAFMTPTDWGFSVRGANVPNPASATIFHVDGGAL